MKPSQCIVTLTAPVLAAGLGLLLWLAGPLLAEEAPADESRAVVLEVDGAIGPATSDFIVRGIDEAEASGAALVILRLNTPGGLDTSMRDIIRRILASAVPVVTYVSPPGSRAASAGTYIMYASHVAAMAPATNLGSATPVSLSPGGLGGGEQPSKPTPADDGEGSDSNSEDGEAGDTGAPDSESQENSSDDAGESGAAQPATAMERKVINDAVAYIKGLARLRGRNEAWAEEAVRSAVNLTAEDALERNVIDIVAQDVPDLLTKLDGRVVTIDGEEIQLATADMSVETVTPDWRTELLSVITNPNVAYVLMLAGIYGLFFELANPGALFPGVLGAISLVLALYAFQVLPVNYAGLALVLLGMAFMVAELFMPSFGVMGIGGTVAFVFGSLILIETDVEAYQISMPLIVTVTVITALFVFTIIGLALRQRERPVVSGREQMLGNTGEALEDFHAGSGRVHIHGETWSARSGQAVRRGQCVKVCELDGLILVVEPEEEQS